MKKLAVGLIVVCSVAFWAHTASARVIVSPSEVPAGSIQTFKVSVSSDRPVSTIAVKLSIPEGVTNVIPNVKPGWAVVTKKGGPDNRVVEISWVGGNIPSERRDEFMFSAQVPASVTTLPWKAYQTYANGVIIDWNIDPQIAEASTSTDSSKPGPYSETKVMSTTRTATEEKEATSRNGAASIALALSLLAVIISGIAARTARQQQMK